VGLIWILAGTAQVIDNGIPWLGMVLVALGVMMVTGVVLARRTWVEVDDDGVRWQGVLRKKMIDWDAVDDVVVDDRGSRFGSNITITLHEKDGTRDGVPSDALAGLEDPGNAELRKRLLDALTTFATIAGVTVRQAKPGDPLVL
jgi:hypothetical protein